MVDILDDSANVTVTDPATGQVQVGTLVWVVDHWRSYSMHLTTSR